MNTDDCCCCCVIDDVEEIEEETDIELEDNSININITIYTKIFIYN